jgi:acetylornithine/LysW-gamma-L-lysine aminotransferase
VSGFVVSEKPVRFERGEGVHLQADDGTTYLDCGASYACAPVGHAHPAVVDAVQSQVAELPFVQASYPTDARDAARAALAAAAPEGLDNGWLCNSGTEAVEAALKFARAATGRPEFVAARRGFHGRTAGSLSVTWKETYRAPYEPLLADVTFVDYGDEAALREAVGEDTAAVVLEPVQGEGGVHPAPEGYLRAARAVTEDAGAALVLDEIQTGMGRTGETWACQGRGVTPDVLTTAKGVASGLPMGAALCADWVAEGAGSHGSTFGGTPVVAAAAAATLEVLHEESLPAHAAEVGAYLREQLAAADLPVRDVRGEGLLVGVEVKRGANRVLKELALDHQVLALPAGRTVVRLLPPLTFEREHADTVVDAMEAVL